MIWRYVLYALKGANPGPSLPRDESIAMFSMPNRSNVSSVYELSFIGLGHRDNLERALVEFFLSVIDHQRTPQIVDNKASEKLLVYNV